jgi:hypothetical protein
MWSFCAVSSHENTGFSPTQLFFISQGSHNCPRQSWLSIFIDCLAPLLFGTDPSTDHRACEYKIVWNSVLILMLSLATLVLAQRSIWSHRTNQQGARGEFKSSQTVWGHPEHIHLPDPSCSAGSSSDCRRQRNGSPLFREDSLEFPNLARNKLWQRQTICPIPSEWPTRRHDRPIKCLEAWLCSLGRYVSSISRVQWVFSMNQNRTKLISPWQQCLGGFSLSLNSNWWPYHCRTRRRTFPKMKTRTCFLHWLHIIWPESKAVMTCGFLTHAERVFLANSSWLLRMAGNHLEVQINTVDEIDDKVPVSTSDKLPGLTV